MDKRTEQAIEERAKIRDQFATHIMAGLMGQSDFTDINNDEAGDYTIDDFAAMASISYKAAAAMMAVRAHWMSKDSQYLSRGKTVPETGMQIL